VLPKLRNDVFDNPRASQNLVGGFCYISLKESEVEKLLQEPLDASKVDLLAKAANKSTIINSLQWQMQVKYNFDTTAFYKALAKLPKLQTFWNQFFWYCHPGSRMYAPERFRSL
jgi:hypothetical protein